MIIRDEDVFLRMSTSTFLFAPYQTDVSAAKALARCFPALYIGIDLDGAVLAVEGCEDGGGFC